MWLICAWMSLYLCNKQTKPNTLVIGHTNDTTHNLRSILVESRSYPLNCQKSSRISYHDTKTRRDCLIMYDAHVVILIFRKHVGDDKERLIYGPSIPERCNILFIKQQFSGLENIMNTWESPQLGTINHFLFFLLLFNLAICFALHK